ncbi:hypothetical protein RYX36_007849 [Vicia faba]
MKNECLKLEQETILPNKRLFPTPVTLDDFFWAFGILRLKAFSRLRNENLVIIPMTAYFDIFYNCTLSPGLLPYLRLVALGGTDTFLLESLFRDSIWGHLELFVSCDNEELLCRAVRDACKSALAGYHTTIEQDCEIKKENLDSRLAIAVGIREGENMVLQQIDDIFKQKEQELDQLEYYQERRLKDLGLCGENGDILGDLEKFF